MRSVTIGFDHIRGLPTHKHTMHADCDMSTLNSNFHERMFSACAYHDVDAMQSAPHSNLSPVSSVVILQAPTPRSVSHTASQVHRELVGGNQCQCHMAQRVRRHFAD